MKIKKNIYNNLSISAYAYGYSCGFVKDSRIGAELYQSLSLDDIVNIAVKNNLGGIEIPVDKYFGNKHIDEFKIFLNGLKEKNLRLIFAFENLDYNFFSSIAPFLPNDDGKFIRIKVSNFYGGNRFKNEIYKIDLNKCRTEISKCVRILDEFKIKILIENHQDVTLKDIINIIEEFGENRVGVNWDTGNSFPTGETVESFLNKSLKYIGNVHLKDYKIQLTPNGYLMHRCALGKGVVDFRFLISKLLAIKKNMPMTIELGAMNGREAFINNELYWQYTEGISEREKQNLINFINLNAENTNEMKSLWELDEIPQVISSAEINEVNESINYIKNILNEIS